MLSKVMIERGHVDTRNRVMTLVCMNVTWGTTVQFVQVCTRLEDRGQAPDSCVCYPIDGAILEQTQARPLEGEDERPPRLSPTVVLHLTGRSTKAVRSA